MRIAVDAHAVGRKLTGNETYIRNIVRELATLGDDHEYHAYVSAPGAENLIPSRFTVHKVSNNPFRRLGFDFPTDLRRLRPDVLHVQYTAPLACPVPVVVSIHDISYLDHPEFFPTTRAWQLRVTVARTVRKAARILTLSEYSRNAILRAYRVPEDRVEVIPLGVDPCFCTMDHDTAYRWVRERYGIPGPYVLTVGDLQPRKNQVGLVDAFAGLMRERPELPHHLVFAGKENWHGQQVREAARRSGFADRIHFTGFVDDADLRRLYCGCDVFAFPSFYEGFGLPVVEAMACGRAVACSDATSLPEVADSAALLFDPNSRDQMAKALRDLLIEPELRARMERLGLQNAARFSWREAAGRTRDAYEAAVGASRREPARAAVRS